MPGYDSYSLASASWEAERARACAEAGFGVDDSPDACERCDAETDDPWRDDGGEAA